MKLDRQILHERLLRSHPDLKKYLLPKEALQNIEIVDLPTATRPLSAARAMLRLANVSRLSEMGSRGPVMGAMPPAGTTQPTFRLFEALFGRDSLRVADILDEWYPSLTLATVVRLAELQGTTYDRYREEEPGRIPHEVRDSADPIARRLTQENSWQWPYYGSVDATPLWMTLAAKCIYRDPKAAALPIVGVDGRSRALADCYTGALRWLVTRLRSNPQALLESTPAFSGSIENQVWKDSWDAYSHADGTVAHLGTVASVEAQALAYDALRGAQSLLSDARRSVVAAVAGDLVEEAASCADDLRDTVYSAFWIGGVGGDTDGYFALGTDRPPGTLSPRPMAVRSSNMGHMLDSSILKGSTGDDGRWRREAIMRQLFSPDMLASAGVRTLSSRERRFRPGSYHNGSTWPWDTYVISRGLDRWGYHLLAAELRRRIWLMCEAVGFYPEFARGDAGPTVRLNHRVVDVWDGQRVNRIEQPPQLVQAWTAAAVLASKKHRCGSNAWSCTHPRESAVTHLTERFECRILADLG